MMPGPGDRLAKSRLAILEHLQYTRHGAPVTHEGAEPAPGAARWSVLRDGARRYWQRHPARLALDLAKPLAGRWARRHPLAFLAIAAGSGALLVLARPWKLISVTGLLLAALRSPHLSALALSAFSRAHDPRDGPGAAPGP